MLRHCQSDRLSNSFGEDGGGERREAELEGDGMSHPVVSAASEPDGACGRSRAPRRRRGERHQTWG